AIGAFISEQFIGDSHLDVGGFPGKHQHRLVLGLPAEFGDGAVIAAGIEATGNAKRAFGRAEGGKVVPENVLRCVLNKSFTEGGNGNTERNIVVLELGRKVRLLQGATVGRINATRDGKQVMDAAIRSTISVFDKARLQSRPIRFQEAWNRIACAIEIGNADLWILERTAPARHRLGVTQHTTVAIKGRSQSSKRLLV